MVDRTQEAELVRRYESLDDDRLLELAGKPDDLTDLAHELVRDEVRRRRLEKAPAPPVVTVTGFDGEYGAMSEQPRGERQLWYRQPGDYAALAPPDCVFPLRDQDNIHAMRVSLILAGIPRDELWPDAKSDLREPMLAVLPEDRDRARQILSAPVSEQVKEQMKHEREDPDDWTPPCCPVCNAPDALLTSIVPSNTWLCEECGNRWADVEA